MEFTIVTPSFRQLDHLGCCIASVADQEGVTVEHLVVDAGTEGFAEFAATMNKRWPDRPQYRRIMISEPDRGMYDAINKGLRKGTGSICAYLNCDEQYLPRVLVQVKKGFAQHPCAEILYGGFLVVDAKGTLVMAQRPVRMFWQHVATSHLPNFTCATFFLRSMLQREQAWFDPNFRACGDAVWTVARLRAKTPATQLPIYTSLFSENSSSLGLGKIGKEEAARLRFQQPAWVRLLGPFWKLIHRGRKLLTGGYGSFPVRTEAYFPQEPRRRLPIQGRPCSLWKSRVWR